MIAKTAPDPGDYEHQAKLIEEHGHDPGYAIWWEQGTGKSRGIVRNAVLLFIERAIGGLFMLAPNGLHRNFVTQQLPVHLPDDIAGNARALFWHQGKSSTKAWQNEARDFMAHKDGLRVLSMSYDGICTDTGKALAKEFLQSTRCLYAADESARIANPDAWRTKVVLGSAPYAPFRRVLTGTPIANAPWDCYTQIKFVDTDFWKPHGLDDINAMKASFGEWDRGARKVPIGMLKREKSLQAFYDLTGVPEVLRTHYEQATRRNTFTGEQEPTGLVLQKFPVIAKDPETEAPKYKNLEMLRGILRPIRSRILKREVLDLPEKLTSPLEFDMSPAQTRCYRAMVDLGFVLTEDGKTCSASMALTLMLRLQQIACGYLVTDLDADRDPNDDDPRVQPINPNPRLELLGELTQDLNHPALIWARFTPDVDAICAMLLKQGKTFARYDGAISDDECAENEERFHRGQAQFFVSKASKGGEGLTLVEAQSAFFYSYSFKLIEYLQASDRPHRIGQHNPVNETIFKARGSIEERMVKSIQAKMDMAAGVTGDRLREWISPVQGSLFG